MCFADASIIKSASCKEVYAIFTLVTVRWSSCSSCSAWTLFKHSLFIVRTTRLLSYVDKGVPQTAARWKDNYYTVNTRRCEFLVCFLFHLYFLVINLLVITWSWFRQLNALNDKRTRNLSLLHSTAWTTIVGIWVAPGVLLLDTVSQKCYTP